MPLYKDAGGKASLVFPHPNPFACREGAECRFINSSVYKHSGEQEKPLLTRIFADRLPESGRGCERLNELKLNLSFRTCLWSF